MKKILFLLIIIVFVFTDAYSETVWVLCQPDSYVNIRPFASKKHEPSGYMECGWKAETNGKTKNGYLFLTDVSNEDGCGWINKSYIVYSEPIIITFKTNVYSKGRVACRRSINGKRRCWVNNGDIVTVYAISKEWAVTNKGFIQTKYLGVDYDILSKRMAKASSDTKSEDLYYEDDE